MIEFNVNDIRDDISSPPQSITNRYTDHYVNDYVLSETYVGVVVVNNDPEKLGRCKIKVYTIYDDIPDSHLPWATPDFSFVGSTKGSFIVPTVGTIVNVYFERGEISLPRYTTKVLNTKQLPSRKDIDYPNNMIFFETEQGDSFELNRKRNTATYTHSSGTQIFIDKDGTVQINSVSNIITNHNDTLTVNGNMVTPKGIGPLCAINICPFSGALHTGIDCSSIGTATVDGDLTREILNEND